MAKVTCQTCVFIGAGFLAGSIITAVMYDQAEWLLVHIGIGLLLARRVRAMREASNA
jgi:hypothetical protein